MRTFTKVRTQGQKANFSGRGFENEVKSIIMQYGCKEVKDSEFSKNPSKYDSFSRLLRTNAKYTNIYGKTGRTEFVVGNRTSEREHRVEVKRQMVKGSVQEKYPYVIENAITRYPEKEVVLILDIPGASDGVIKYLREAVSTGWRKEELKRRGKKIYIFDSLNEYKKWLEKDFFAA